MDKTISEQARSIRLHAGLPLTLGDAINAAVYLNNHRPSILLKCILLKEVWDRNEVKLSCLKVFVFIFYVHIDCDTCSKLDNKLSKYYFIGYGMNRLAYGFGMIRIGKSLVEIM